MGRWLSFEISALALASALAVPAVTAGTEVPAGAGKEPNSRLRVTYLANEGVLVEPAPGSTTGTGPKVLIDALFGEGLDHYPVVPAQSRRRLEAAEPPYDGVTLVLATHRHGDHFDPQAVARFLRASPNTQFLSTPQAAAELRRATAGELQLQGRIRSVLPAEGEAERLSFPGFELTVLQLHHGRGREVQNLGFLLHVGDTNLLHVGDTEVTVPDLKPYGPIFDGVDLALLPVWYLTYERWQPVVREILKPRRILGFHLANATAPASYFGPDGDRKSRLERAHLAFPDAVLATEPLTVFDALVPP